MCKRKRPKHVRFPMPSNVKPKSISAMTGNFILSKEECYCGIEDFYRRVAVMAELSPDKVFYDCTKICVTKPVQDQIFAFYKEKKQASKETICQAWAVYGPKASLTGVLYEVRYDPGFFSEV